MKKMFSLFVLQVLFLNAVFSANSFAEWTKTELTLNNGIVKRIIKLPAEDGI